MQKGFYTREGPTESCSLSLSAQFSLYFSLSLPSLQALYPFKTLIPYSLVDLGQMSAEDLTLQ